MSTYKEQKITKPKPEDVAGDFLDAEKTAAFLNLVEFIRANKIGIRWASANSWTLNFKSKRLGYLKIHDQYGFWWFCHNHPINNYYSMEECDLKSFVFDNLYARDCEKCRIKRSIIDMPKAGVTNQNICACWPLRVFNPDGEVMEQTKRLIEYRMKCILEASK